ncbi:hypothetical protein ACFWWT_45350 [Streptomyces sp. NPDC058676]|uniref:hypothetical protein n=1 Tax=unclassified Streptomyces TaxID=2593676 RepID=UPI003655841D
MLLGDLQVVLEVGTGPAGIETRINAVRRRTTTANCAFADPEDLITAVRRGLRQLQYRQDVLGNRWALAVRDQGRGCSQ